MSTFTITWDSGILLLTITDEMLASASSKQNTVKGTEGIQMKMKLQALP